MTHPCSHESDISKIQEDVAYIRGRVDAVVDSHESRIGSLETTVRGQGILGMLATAGLAILAWAKGVGS